MKTSELSGAALDWAVAKCEGLDYFEPDIGPMEPEYSTDWSQGGPIIEREGIDVFCRPTGSKHNPEPDWCSAKYLSASECAAYLQGGPTPLIAAMRCYVASKLGDEVEVPADLLA